MNTFPTALLCAIIGFVAAYPTGAPIETCKTFNANHTGHSPQNSKSNYEIVISPSSIPSGEFITVTIQGVGDKFKGFFIQGQDPTGQPVGTFQSQSDAQTLDCNKKADSATHVNNNDKDKVTLQWKSPSYKGKVIFRAVIVKKYELFWNNLVSAPLTVV